MHPSDLSTFASRRFVTLDLMTSTPQASTVMKSTSPTWLVLTDAGPTPSERGRRPVGDVYVLDSAAVGRWLARPEAGGQEERTLGDLVAHSEPTARPC